MHASCEGMEDWLETLPSIIGEERGRKFQIEVDLGNAKGVIKFDPTKRSFSFEERPARKQGILYIEVTLTNEKGQ